jgi:Phage tail assembly chaperone proteins, E, or 41 or 14
MANPEAKAAAPKVAPPDDKPETEAPAPSQWPLVIKLREPIIAHGDKITELKFREPTALDYEQIGDPVRIIFNPDGTFQHEINPAKMNAMLAQLAAVNLGAIRQIKVPKLKAISFVIANSFLPDWGESAI